MKATFRVADHPLLLEANPGLLFTPVGPDLVECVCAVVSRHNGVGAAHASSDRQLLDTEGTIDVVVIACRVDPDEPEYYPTGVVIALPSVTPIHFLTQMAPAQFAAKHLGGPVTVNRALPIVLSTNAPHDMLCSAIANHGNLARSELASRL